MLVTERQNQFIEMTAGASVALVGGHDDVDWERVNLHDIVVRVNAHWLRQGGRCDVLYYSCENDLPVQMFEQPDLYREPASLKFAWLNASHGLFGAGDYLKRAYCRLRENGVTVSTYYAGPPDFFDKHLSLVKVAEEYRWTEHLAKTWNFHPFTGIIALAHLVLHENISEIYVTGMNLYQKPDRTLPTKVGRHHITGQLNFLKSVREDPRVTFSPVLLSAIDH